MAIAYKVLSFLKVPTFLLEMSGLTIIKIHNKSIKTISIVQNLLLQEHKLMAEQYLYLVS